MSKKPIAAPALALVATLLSALQGWSADAVTRRPQLFLSIMVDGLRSDYLELLSEYFGSDGFNRLMRDGVILDQVEYGPLVDAAGATAMVYTGAAPDVNGIATASVYSTERHLTLPALLDPSKIGNYTSETLSPAALLASTISDEVRIDGGGASYVHSIAPDAARAIIMAGHAGNSAFWINDADGRWATTTHYRDVPQTITTRNFSNPLSHRIDTITWAPLLAADKYPALPEHKRHYGFLHTFTGASADKYRRFKLSAPVNEEVTSVATDYIRSMRLGGRDAMDMLSVAYTVAPYPGSTDTNARLETMDAYLRLDRQLARLLKEVDAQAGTGNAVILLTGTPSPAPTDPDDPKWGLPTGEFSARKAMSLLNMYLIACHGNGEWVTDFSDGRLYLNNKLIADKHLSAEDVRSDAAKFLMKMSGVAAAHTIDDILEHRTDESLKRNTVVSQAADIYITIQPGWVMVDDTKSPTVRTTVRYAATDSPAIVFAPGRLLAARIATPVDARQIAPTVARILRIRSPNGAANSTISTIFAK
jgi:hypothetical protein